MKKKLFTEKQVDLSAVLAGPLPPGFLIYRNYKALGKEKEAYIALASTLIFTAVFFYGMFLLPQDVLDEIPSFAFTAFYGILVFIFFRKLLAKDVNEAIESGVAKGSNWSVVGITVLGSAINLLIIFGLAINQPFYEGKVAEAGGNELYYDETVPPDDVSKLFRQLEAIDFFVEGYENVARLQLINDTYRITVLVDEQFWVKEEISGFTSLKWLMEVEFGRKTTLQFESVSLSGTSKYMEL